MTTDNKNSITGFNVITTNDDNTVLNNVTRDDIIDIIVEIKKISKVSKFTEIMDLFDKHIKQYNKINPLDYRYELITEICNLLQTTIPIDGVIPSTNPHNTKIEHLVGNILDRLYALWLLRGNSESLDSFRQVIFNVFKYGSALDVFNRRREDLLISVAEFRNYFLRFHEDLLDKYDDAIFVVSQSKLHWPGSVQGYLVTASPDDPSRTILVKESVDSTTTYTCSIDISPRFKSANVYVDISSTAELSVDYRIGAQTTWVPLTDKIFVDVYKQVLEDGEIIDILDPQTYRYRLPVELNKLLTSKLSLANELNVSVEFRILPKEVEFGIHTIDDISIIVDGTDQISDDIYKIEFYADTPHESIIDKFISNDISSTYISDYYTTNCLCSSTEPFSFNTSGSICFRCQPTFYNFRTPKGDEIIKDEIITYELLSLKTNTNKLLTITVTIHGKHIVGTNSKYSYGSITNMYLSLVDRYGTAYPLSTLAKDNRSVYSGVITYVNGNNISYSYRDTQGTVITKLLPLTEITDTPILVTPTLMVGDDKFGNIIGTHELVYYKTIINKAAIEMYLMDKI